VCPRYSDDGEEQYPHPLWDEIAAALENPDRISFLEKRLPAAATSIGRKKRDPAALPKAQTDWKTKKKLTRRKKESPSGVGALIGCSLKWALQYKARLRGGEAAALDDSNRLLGELVHEIIARLLRGGKLAPGEAGKKARKLFDDEGPRLAASFFLPGADAMRADARRIVGEAARDLFTFLEDAGISAIHVEEDLETKALAGTFTGRPDLVAGSPTRVIDLKWGGLQFWRDQISAGTAHQLAAYGRILAGKGEGELPPGAVYIISRQNLLTSEPEAFPESVPIPGPNANEVWAAVEKAYRARAKELAGGALASPGPDERNKKDKDKIKPHIGEEDGTMVLPPPCRFCDYGGLCGAGYADG
jgi:RecB family exonuclease